MVHELLARERLAGMAGEEAEQLELALGEGDLLAVEAHAPAARIHDEPVEAQRRLLLGDGVERRSTASTRATSSAGENGFTT